MWFIATWLIVGLEWMMDMHRWGGASCNHKALQGFSFFLCIWKHLFPHKRFVYQLKDTSHIHNSTGFFLCIWKPLNTWKDLFIRSTLHLITCKPSTISIKNLGELYTLGKVCWLLPGLHPLRFYTSVVLVSVNSHIYGVHMICKSHPNLLPLHYWFVYYYFFTYKRPV